MGNVFLWIFWATLLVSGISFVASQEDEEDKKMIISMTGTYELISPPGDRQYGEYLTALAYSDELRDSILAMKPVKATVEKDGTMWKLKIKSRFSTIDIHFVSGQEFEETLYDLRKVKTTAIVGHNSIIKVQKFDDFEARQVVIFNKDGFKVNFSAKGKFAEQEYRRITPTQQNPDE